MKRLICFIQSQVSLIQSHLPMRLHETNLRLIKLKYTKYMKTLIDKLFAEEEDKLYEMV